MTSDITDLSFTIQKFNVNHFYTEKIQQVNLGDLPGKVAEIWKEL